MRNFLIDVVSKATATIRVSLCLPDETPATLNLLMTAPLPDLVRLSPAALRVVDACRSIGGRPLIVGGSVRDALLANGRQGIVAKDIDIEVSGLTDAAALVIALEPLGAVGVHGASFSVIGLRIDDEFFDLSLTPTDDSERDAFARRDFTLNALGWDPRSGELIDHFGGESDLSHGILRHTSEHFADDPLRVLRGVQLAGRFGFRFASETKSLAREISSHFDELAVERVWGEWQKLARRATHWPAALDALHDSGWDTHFPELAATRGIRQDQEWHSEGDVWTHLGLAAESAARSAERDSLAPADREVVVLATLLHDLGKVTNTQIGSEHITSHGHAEAGVAPASAFLRRIGAPDAVITRALPLVREHMAHISVKGVPSRPAVRRLIRRLASAGTGASLADWARVVDADCAGRGRSAKPSPTYRWLAVAESMGPVERRGFITGAHLIARGVVPGPQLGVILAKVRDAQDDEVFTDEAGAIAWLDTQLTHTDAASP